MRLLRSRIARRAVGVCAVAGAFGTALAACSSRSASEPGPTSATGSTELRATIRRTEFGIPHVLADDLPSAAFGQGFALAEDHVCILADQIVKVRSERSRYFGAGENDANLNSDFGYLALRIMERARDVLARQRPEIQAFLAAFARGYDLYLERVAPDARPPACANAPWVTPIDAADLMAHYIDLGLVGLPQALLPYVATAQPPPPERASFVAPADAQPFDAAALAAALPSSRPASNGWALGRRSTASGAGIVVANPHFPWEGELMMHEAHLRVPGKLDVYGASLVGVAGVLIGFNRDVAWTHTFSTATQSTVYALTLDPADPTTYVVDGEKRAMESRVLSVDVLGKDGALGRVERRLYASHHGPILALPNLGWSSARAYALRSANLENETMAALFYRIATARSLDDVERANAEERGMPWANTMAADRGGDVLYMDSTRVPHLSQATLARWRAVASSDLVTSSLASAGLYLLDGSRKEDDWLPSPERPKDAVVPWAESPRLRRDDFVANANDSYWISNPAAPLKGHSPLFGATDLPLSPRTRANFSLLSGPFHAEAAGDDGLFDRPELVRTLLGNRSYAPALFDGTLVARCRAAAAPDAAAGCDELARWDGRFDLDSPGAVLAREVLAALEDGDDSLFAVPFDPASPLDTPRGITEAGAERVAAAVRTAQERLAAAGVPMSATLRDTQFTLRAGERLPVHGCRDGLEGCTNVVKYTRLASTLYPPHARGPRLSPRSGLTAEGYPVNYGSSFMMVVEMTGDGPRGEALLTYGESSDERSPHVKDQLALTGRKELRPLRFEEAEIAADGALRITEIRAPR